MAKARIEILAPAWNDLDEIATYHLHLFGPNSAKKITDKLLDALKRLEEYPLSCPYVLDEELKLNGYRMLVCDQYVCIYKLVDDVIYVYHIANGKTEYAKLFK